MSHYFIGPYQFIHLSMAPEAPRQAVEVESRSGVADVSVWRTGIRGHSFTTQSVVDQASLVACETLYRLYEGLVGGNPVQVQWGSIVINAGKYIVLDVKIVEMRKLTLGHGGLNNGDAILRAEWTLQPMIP